MTKEQVSCESTEVSVNEPNHVIVIVIKNGGDVRYLFDGDLIKYFRNPVIYDIWFNYLFEEKKKGNVK